jgi:hypothetical protein
LDQITEQRYWQHRGSVRTSDVLHEESVRILADQRVVRGRQLAKPSEVSVRKFDKPSAPNVRKHAATDELRGTKNGFTPTRIDHG